MKPNPSKDFLQNEMFLTNFLLFFPLDLISKFNNIEEIKTNMQEIKTNMQEES